MFNKIPEQVISDVQNAHDIVDVIGEYVQLNKQGQNYFGLCPFHGEKTPSFSVTKEKQIFYCFGCKKGGNVFTFLMEHEGLSFYEAVKSLADRSGIKLPAIKSEHSSSLSEESQNILSAYEWTTKFYHHVLKYTKEGERGYQYLRERGIDEASIEAFQIGFAPSDDELTIKFLKEKGFHRQILTAAGLLNAHDDERLTDPLAGRVVFPIRNHLGKVVAFSARAIRDQQPKYLNSTESEVFKKSRLLFNFDQARRLARKQNKMILFEGQLDVIAAHQVDVKNVVATLGTSLTESQAKLLNRYVQTVIICYDDDQAGLEASYRAANLIQKMGCQVMVSSLGEGLDPDGYFQKYGAKAFQENVIEQSDPYIAFYMRYLKKDYHLNRQGDRITYLQKVLKEIAKVRSSIEREHYLVELSDQYQLSLDALREEMRVFQRNKRFDKDKRSNNRYTKDNMISYQDARPLPAFHNAERRLLAYMLQDKDITDKVQQELGASFRIDEHSVIATHLYAYYEEHDTANISLFIDRLNDETLKQRVLELSLVPMTDDISYEEIDDYIKVIQREADEKVMIQKYREEQREAEKNNDHIRAAQIAMQIIEIKKKLKNV